MHSLFTMTKNQRSSKATPQTRSDEPEGPAAGNITNKTVGGARRDRTDDLLNANQALSQLSYGPEADNRAVGHQVARSQQVIPAREWWAWDDSNVRPHPYQGCALTP